MTDESDQLRRSIGDVLTVLQDEFPDISVSKIRYLESQGLVQPARAHSGYRQFDDDDIALLQWVLRQQRDHFLPLRVIREKLAAGDVGDDDQPPPSPTSRARVSPIVGIDTTLSLDIAELEKASGLTESELTELESFGLIESTSVAGSKRYDGTALLMARLAARFAELGIEARHLRMYKVATDREAGVLEQIVAPLVGSGRDEVTGRLIELIELGGDVRRVLLGRDLSPHL